MRGWLRASQYNINEPAHTHTRTHVWIENVDFIASSLEEVTLNDRVKCKPSIPQLGETEMI